MFEKSLSELIQFCAEMNMWAEGKNANIEQLYLMVQEVFQTNSTGLPGSIVPGSMGANDPIMHGLAGPGHSSK